MIRTEDMTFDRYVEQVSREMDHTCSKGLSVEDCPVEEHELWNWWTKREPPECIATLLYERLKADREGREYDEPEDVCD
jgi:hypothetical protein